MEANTVIKDNKTLFYRGNADLLNHNIVAVIGKREANKEALSCSYQVGQWLAKDGFVVLNGLAIGCDEEAIMGALHENGRVIAVLPSDIDNIYPAKNKQLATEIIEKGGLIISQFPKGTKIEKSNFIERDMVQALLSDKVISIYCDENSGTMHTLRFAHKYDKDIGCVMDCSGNEYAIKRFNARKIYDRADVIDFANTPKGIQLSMFDNRLFTCSN